MRRAASSDPGPPPDAAGLRQAALAHLARYATTEAGLLRVLQRRIDRWRRVAAGDEAGEAAAAARRAAQLVVAELAAAGAVSDAGFADSRARRLLRAGHSRRAVVAHLAARGVGTATAQAALPDDPQAELAAALAFARRRRIGPFRIGGSDAATRLRALGALARAGFPRAIAEQALAMDPPAAESLVARLRRD